MRPWRAPDDDDDDDDADDDDDDGTFLFTFNTGPVRSLRRLSII